MAEFPGFGQHCAVDSCNLLDFLPVICDACRSPFCAQHFRYDAHSCPKLHLKDNQIPVCPMCNQPIPFNAGLSADELINAHLDNNCQIRKKKSTFPCELKGCKSREFVEVKCSACKHNFCLSHRYPDDHYCTSMRPNDKLKKQNISKEMSKNTEPNIELNTENDESLAKALQDLWNNELSEKEARRIQSREYSRSRARAGDGRSNGCHIS